MSLGFKELGERFAAYLSGRWQQGVILRAIERIPGGASRETYRVKVVAGGDEHGLVLRRDPVTSLIDTERALEYRTYVAIHGTAVPVPEPVLLEEDPRYLDRPFSVMREVPGCVSDVNTLTGPDLQAKRQRLGGQKWRLLGKLARMDIHELGVTAWMETPEHPALRELSYWADVIATDALTPQPIAAAAIRWLRRNLPPPPTRLALVHGDYRSGNFLFDDNADIRAVLDWEMAHIGDPLEDLAWSLDPLWSWDTPELAGGLLPRRQALEIWQNAAGLEVDAAALRWWQVFASVKAIAIWVSSTEDFAHGESKEPILAMAGWIMTDRQNRILFDRLSPTSDHDLVEPLL